MRTPLEFLALRVVYIGVAFFSQSHLTCLGSLEACPGRISLGIFFLEI